MKETQRSLPLAADDTEAPWLLPVSQAYSQQEDCCAKCLEHGNSAMEIRASKKLGNFSQMPDVLRGEGFFLGVRISGCPHLSDSLLSAWGRGHFATAHGKEFGLNKSNLWVRREEQSLHPALRLLTWCPPVSPTYLTGLL